MNFFSYILCVISFAEIQREKVLSVTLFEMCIVIVKMKLNHTYHAECPYWVYRLGVGFVEAQPHSNRPGL